MAGYIYMTGGGGGGGGDGTFFHNQLLNRGWPDQHPIAAISGLQDILNALQNVTLHEKGFFDTVASLEAAYSTATIGDFATVGETNTVWYWNGTAWTDTGAVGQVLGVTVPSGRQTGEVIILLRDFGINSSATEIDNAVTRVAILKVDGDGTKYLGDDGQYHPM